MTIERKAEDFYFCKTARKPYDTVCVALMLLAEFCFSEFSWHSDGIAEDFVEGRRFLADSKAILVIEL
jgi:hypothetical protein